jgi:uncharacterized damage-inducible protein DinB
MQFVDRVFLPLYEIVHDVAIGMVEAMPEEYIDFRPAPGIRSFREQLVHIASVERAMALGAAGQGWEFEASGYRPEDFIGRTVLWNLLLQTRDEVISLARSISFHRLHTTIPTPWGFEATPAQILILMRDHTNNHNGKLSVYLRLVGPEPPFFLSIDVDTMKHLIL